MQPEVRPVLCLDQTLLKPIPSLLIQFLPLCDVSNSFFDHQVDLVLQVLRFALASQPDSGLIEALFYIRVWTTGHEELELTVAPLPQAIQRIDQDCSFRIFAFVKGI